MSENKRTHPQDMGKARFVLIRGVICYGIPVGIIIVFMNAIRSEGFSATFQPITIVSCSIGGILYGSIVGIIYGLIMWKYYKKKRNNVSETSSLK